MKPNRSAGGAYPSEPSMKLARQRAYEQSSRKFWPQQQQPVKPVKPTRAQDTAAAVWGEEQERPWFHTSDVELQSPFTLDAKGRAIRTTDAMPGRIVRNILTKDAMTYPINVAEATHD